jgi:hypothetical protein
MSNMSRKIQRFVLLIVGVLAMCFAIGYLVFAWVEPTQAPPGGNAPAPINVGSTAQTKTGNLTLPNLYLNATGNEGNIYAIDQLIGYNDLRLKGRSDEAAPIYYGASVHRFYTAGTERLTILNNGNVGIGTTLPTQTLSFGGDTPRTIWMERASAAIVHGQRLTIQAGGAFSGALNAEGGELRLSSGISRGLLASSITFYTPSPSMWGFENIPTERMRLNWVGLGIGTSPGARLHVRNPSGAGLTVLANLENLNDAANNNGLLINIARTAPNTDAYALNVQSGGTSRLYVRSDGNVGIGTTNPAYKLDVVGGYIRSDTGFCIGSSCITSWSGAGGGNYWVLSGSNLYTSSTAWNVGIGTTSPQRKLHIHSGFPQIRTTDPSGGETWEFGSGTGGWAIYNATDGAYRLWIGNDGNVGIGTTSPGVKLDIVGDRARLQTTSGTGGPYFILKHGGEASGREFAVGSSGSANAPGVGKFEIYDSTANASRLVIDANGKVGIGTTDPVVKLHVKDGWLRVGDPGPAGSPAGAADNAIQFETQSGFHRVAFKNLRFWDWDYGDMVTFNDGNVGIGTTGPTQKLEVEGGNISIDAWDSQYRGGYSAGGYSDRRMIGGAHGWDPNKLYINGWNDWTSGVSIGGPGGSSNLEVTGNLTVGGRISSNNWPKVEYATLGPGSCVEGDQEILSKTITVNTTSKIIITAYLPFNVSAAVRPLVLIRRDSTDLWSTGSILNNGYQTITISAVDEVGAGRYTYKVVIWCEARGNVTWGYEVLPGNRNRLHLILTAISP